MLLLWYINIIQRDSYLYSDIEISEGDLLSSLACVYYIFEKLKTIFYQSHVIKMSNFNPSESTDIVPPI